MLSAEQTQTDALLVHHSFHAQLAHSPTNTAHADLRFHRLFVGITAVSIAQFVARMVAFGGC